MTPSNISHPGTGTIKESSYLKASKFTQVRDYAIISSFLTNNVNGLLTGKLIIRECTLYKEKKTEIIEDFKRSEGDTGSTEIQVALLTQRINELTRHMTSNRHDFHTQRGLLKLVGQRRRLLAYLGKKNKERYQDLISRLGLRK